MFVRFCALLRTPSEKGGVTSLTGRARLYCLMLAFYGVEIVRDRPFSPPVTKNTLHAHGICSPFPQMTLSTAVACPYVLLLYVPGVWLYMESSS